VNKPLPQKDRPVKRLYSIKEAAAYLGRSVCALREMQWAGKLPYIKDTPGHRGRVFFDILDLDKWIDENKIQFTF